MAAISSIRPRPLPLPDASIAQDVVENDIGVIRAAVATLTDRRYDSSLQLRRLEGHNGKQVRQFTVGGDLRRKTNKRNVKAVKDNACREAEHYFS